MRRRAALGGGLGLLLAAPRLARSQGPVRARDLLGRDVSLPRPARRVALAQGRHLLALNLLHPEPAALIAAWRDDFRRDVPAEYAPFARRFPALDLLPSLGRTAEDLSAETMLAAAPDLVLFSRWLVEPGGGGARLLPLLEAAGVPAAVVDFFVSPMRDTEPSLAILGALLGREEQAARLAAFRRERLDAVAGRLRGATARPLVLLHAHAGATPCCNSPGRGTFDDLVRAAGGANLGAELLPGLMGPLSPETVLARDPALYVATGGSFGNRGFRLGGGVSEAEARASLAAVLAEPPLSALPAVRAGRAHGFWHGFNDTPAHVLAVEALLGWTHPDRAAGIDPRASLDTLNEHFAAVPMRGTYWV